MSTIEPEVIEGGSSIEGNSIYDWSERFYLLNEQHPK